LISSGHFFPRVEILRILVALTAAVQHLHSVPPVARSADFYSTGFHRLFCVGFTLLFLSPHACAMHQGDQMSLRTKSPKVKPNPIFDKSNYYMTFSVVIHKQTKNVGFFYNFQEAA
jgi:hypothetical protein